MWHAPRLYPWALELDDLYFSGSIIPQLDYGDFPSSITKT